MANESLRALIRHLHRVVDPAGLGCLSDGQLLERFRNGRDESAFEVLIWRHGPMVLSVCRRVLRDEQDAEDAFQATFLVLVRKAGSIAQLESVGSWLYKVAYRAALEARTRSSRWTETVPHGAGPPAPEGIDAAVWRELRVLLDEEVDRLPVKYREPFVLCYLEGQTTDAAARTLKCPRGTVATRLAWARQRLRNRLAQRGVALSVAALTAALASRPATASPALFSSTLQTGLHAAEAPAPVLSLTEGVLRTMFMSKMKTAAVVLLTLAAIVAGGGLAVRQTMAARPDGVRPAETQPDEKPVVPKKEGEKEDRPARKDGEKRDGDVRRPVRAVVEVKATDPEKLTLTGMVRERDGDEPTEKKYEIARDHAVILDGRQAELRDLKAGMRATLQFARDGQKVLIVTVIGGERKPEREGGERKDGERPSPSVQVELKTIDVAKLSVTALVRTDREDGKPIEKAFTIDREHTVMLDGKQASLADLKSGMKATLLLGRDGKTVRSITVGKARGDRDGDK